MASLSVEGSEDIEAEEDLRAEAEIVLIKRSDAAPRVLRFDTEQAGALCFGSHVEDVNIVMPHTRVEIGPGPEIVLVAPVNIESKELSISAKKVIVEDSSDQKPSAVVLEAETFEGTEVSSIPLLRGNVTLSASWPGVSNYPWNRVTTKRLRPNDRQVDEALRRFRKFVIALRSHGKGGLARFRHKMEHARMTKGPGQAILDLMEKEGILSLERDMYFLDPNKLGELTGTTYVDCAAYRFGEKTVNFVRKALESPDR